MSSSRDSSDTNDEYQTNSPEVHDDSFQTKMTSENAVVTGSQSSRHQQEDDVDSAVVMRNKVRFEGSQSPAFKRQARLSKLLQDDDESSSDEEDLYTSPPIPPSSNRKLPQQIHQTSSAVNDRMIDNVVVNNDIETREIEEECEPEIVPMQLLSKIVNPEVLSQVKGHLRSAVTRRRSHPVVTAPVDASPAKLWEMRKKLQNDKALLNKTQASIIKSGWKIRQCIANLPHGDNINTLYLTLVRRGMHREVDALFSMAKVTRALPFSEFDRNILDEDCNSALIIAIDTKDESMIRKLLEHNVDVGLSIFHAIEADFMEGLKLILAYDPCPKLKIITENYRFQIGMTPMIMAAHRDNYRVLSLLHDYGHTLTELTHWSDGIQVAWESSNERRMICLARAKPSYITLKTEVFGTNPMDYCFEQLKLVRQCAAAEHEFSAFYKDIGCKYEEYMCSLLDFICSSDELSDLFQFERPLPQVNRQKQIGNYIDGAKEKRWQHFTSFELLEKASRENLIRFVTHQQSQLALSCMRYRTVPFLRNNLIAYAIGFLFPFLSIFYICAPNSALGGIITLPVVSFYCHMLSDLMFALLLLLKILTRDVQFDRLGEPVSWLEWLIFIWILGKWVQEIQECINRGPKSYFRDIWNYTDLSLLSLFTVSMWIRLYDAISNAELEHISRYEWGPLEPRLIGEGMQAFGYVFLFLRLLGLTRADRYLGPLQISLGKMLADVVRFLCLFALVLGAFAFGLSDLYWYYGTSEGLKLFCNESSSNVGKNTNLTCKKQSVAFTSIYNSMVDLFWALFGLFDLDKMSLQGKHAYTEYVGRSLVATYHVVAIIVMLNMLIAMMSKTYEDTSKDEEIAWKFQRTSVWIRFIRKEVVRPPPMNLIPTPWRLKESFGRLRKFIRRCCHRGDITVRAYNREEYRTPQTPNKKKTSTCHCCRGSVDNQEAYIIETKNDSDDSTEPQTMLKSRPSSSSSSSTRRFHCKAKAVLKKLVFRYKIKHLTKKG